MRVSTPLLFRQGVDAITTAQARLGETQSQIARGTRILSPADDPAGAKRLLDLRQTLELTARHRANAGAAITRLGIEDSTLATAGSVLQRVRELALQGNNATLTEPDRAALAAEVEQRLGELLGLANAKDGNNEYLFAGTATATRPFSRGPGGFAYAGDQGRRALFLNPDFELTVGDPGSAVFQRIPTGNGTFRVLDDPANAGGVVADAGTVTDPAAFVPDTYTIRFPTPATFEVRDSAATLVTSGSFASGESIAFLGVEVALTGTPAAGDAFRVEPASAQDVFTTVDDLAAALRGPAGDAAGRARMHNAVNRAIADLDQALENVSAIRASVGARLNAAQSERFVAEDLALQVQAAISAIEDVDLAAAVSLLNQQRGILEAAQRSFAAVQGLSLFDLL